MEENSEKERAIEERFDEKDRDSASVIDRLKKDIDRVIGEKIEMMILHSARREKTANLELEVRRLRESLKISRDEEALMRARVLELEEGSARKDSALEDKRRELDQGNRARCEIERVKARLEGEVADMRGEMGRVKGVVDELEGTFSEFVEKNGQLVSEVHRYKSAFDQVVLEKDNLRKGFEEMKAKAEKLEPQVAGMEKRVEQADNDLGQTRSEKEKLNERNKELERNVDVLMKEKEALKKEKTEVEKLELQVSGMKKKTEQADTELGQMRSEKEKLNERNKELESNLDVLMKENDELKKEKTKVEKLELQVAGMLKKMERADSELGQIGSEKEKLNERNKELESNLDVLMKEKEALKKEKTEVENVLKKEKTKLEMQVADLKKKIERADSELGQMGSEREKLNERNKELESNVGVLMKEKDELQNTLLEAQQECDHLNIIVRNKRKESNLTEEISLRKKGKFEQSHVHGENVLESDPDLRRSKEDTCSPLNSNAPFGPEIVQCPDTDFNDFGKDIAEDSFAVNQFWAIYDEKDGMPRFYARVRNVYSASPFKLKITWLVPDSDDQGEIDWHDAHLPIACGKFKLGHSKNVTDPVIFSHQIQCLKRSGKGSYLVYPKKGETWAIFRDWHIKWSSNPENHLTDEFEYVEILSDFTENVGIEVAYLVKVKGFVCLFQKAKKNGVNISRVVPKELYRFSHRIPSYKMTGKEREGVPRGCFELDTAALPTNFC